MLINHNAVLGVIHLSIGQQMETIQSRKQILRIDDVGGCGGLGGSWVLFVGDGHKNQSN